MNFLKFITKLLNKVYRLDKFIEVWLAPISIEIARLYNQVSAIKNNYFFDNLDNDGCRHYEKLLGLVTDESVSLEDRRSRIQAKWLSNNHNNIALIQSVCDSWKNGEIEADFIDGKIQIRFVGSFGVPSDLESLKESINEVKPAHLPYLILFKYLLIENIHEVKTLEEMEKITLEQFAFGKE